jgi:hypothetical protein
MILASRLDAWIYSRIVSHTWGHEVIAISWGGQGWSVEVHVMVDMQRSRKQSRPAENLLQWKIKCFVVSSDWPHAHAGEFKDLKWCWWKFRREWLVTIRLSSQDRCCFAIEAEEVTDGKKLFRWAATCRRGYSTASVWVFLLTILLSA